ncbi:MAG TPA: M23 family metallopeptidase [Acidimicrobiales bacterium]|nr:M23 family metallopeptidase [Acidimicrobiales bacterium]
MSSRRSRFLTAFGLTAAAVLSVTTGAAAQIPCLSSPVDAPVAVAFRAPSCPWCPGQRGLEFANRAGAPVRAAGPGTVTFAGPVAGRVWVTVAHAEEVRTSYGPLSRMAVRRGADVVAGQLVGTSAGPLHFGVRVAGSYVDPAPLLGRTVRLVPRLVPLDGWVRPPPTSHCPAERARAPAGGAGPSVG